MLHVYSKRLTRSMNYTRILRGQIALHTFTRIHGYRRESDVIGHIKVYFHIYKNILDVGCPEPVFDRNCYMKLNTFEKRVAHQKEAIQEKLLSSVPYTQQSLGTNHDIGCSMHGFQIAVIIYNEHSLIATMLLCMLLATIRLTNQLAIKYRKTGSFIIVLVDINIKI